MRTSRLVAAVILALVGLVWLAQGLGILGGSAMSGSAFWAAIGVILIAAAGILLVAERRRRSAG